METTPMRCMAYPDGSEPQVQSEDNPDGTLASGFPMSDDGTAKNPFVKGIINASLISIPVWSVIIGLVFWLF